MNYLDIIGEYYEGVQCDAPDPYDYDTIVWHDEQVLQTALEAKWLDAYKVEYITAMSQQARADIVKGFVSHALGGLPQIDYTYDSGEEDQLNMIGAVAAGDDMYYPCRVDGVKTYILHTHEQLLQVCQDGRDVKLSVLQTFTTKQGQILSASSKSEVDAIVW